VAPAHRPRAASRQNYSKEELIHFLGVMHVHMPIGGNKWDLVLDQHSLSYPGREVEYLRRKFAQLYRSRTPTRDPRCPREVKLANCVKYAISSRAGIGDGTEEMDLATGRFTHTAHDEEGRDINARSFGDDAAHGEDDAEFEDEVPCEFQAPSVPNNDINLLLAQATAAVASFIGPVAPSTGPAATRMAPATVPATRAPNVPATTVPGTMAPASVATARAPTVPTTPT
jgi:hypothetical protein